MKKKSIEIGYDEVCRKHIYYGVGDFLTNAFDIY